MAASPTPARSAATDDLGFPRESPNCPGPQPRAARGPRSLRRGGPWKNLSVTAGPQPRPQALPQAGEPARAPATARPLALVAGISWLCHQLSRHPARPPLVQFGLPAPGCLWALAPPGASLTAPLLESSGRGCQASRLHVHPQPAFVTSSPRTDRQTDRRVSVCSPHASHPGRGLDRSCFLPTPAPDTMISAFFYSKMF